MSSRSGLIYARFVLCLLLPLSLYISPALGLEDGRIGVLFIGSLHASYPFWQMRSDPLFRMGYVPANLRGDWMALGPMATDNIEGVHRMVRLYMPRTYDDTVGNYDVIVLQEANLRAVLPHVEKLAESVSEGGMGLLMCGGWASFGASGNTDAPPWGETAIGRLLPTEDIIGTWHDTGNVRMVIDEPDHELMSSVPWNWNDPGLRDLALWAHNLVTLKLGAKQLAHVIPRGHDREDPLMVTWELEGRARVFALTGDGYRLIYWMYGYDMGANLMIYLDRRSVPQDIMLVHAVRSEMSTIATRRFMLISLLEFSESFGANTHEVTAGLGDVDLITAEAGSHYLELNYEGALESYEEASRAMGEIEAQAVRLKERALLWVYIIEWLTVTGTALFCGVILWTLMVRRRLYREVGATRLTG